VKFISSHVVFFSKSDSENGLAEFVNISRSYRQN